MSDHLFWGMGRRGARRYLVGVSLVVMVCASTVTIDDLSAQLINEVIAENNTQMPADIEGGFPDMVEIYNDQDGQVILGKTALDESYYLSCVPAPQDPPVFDAVEAWAFPPNRSTIARNGRLTIFLAGNESQGTCELHATFTLASDGSEAIVLWGPEAGDGSRPVVDRVYLPPLAADVSWGRSPDGAGGPNLTPTEHEEHFTRFPPGESSFGGCSDIPGICLIPCCGRRHCTGAANKTPLPSWNLRPRITRISQSSNASAAGEAVEFVARVRDDNLPIPDNLSAVQISYRVKLAGEEDFSPEEMVEMAWDDTIGEGGILTSDDRPLDRYTHWRGEIPGQPAGARVEFFFRVLDGGQLTGTRPRNLCHLMDVYGEGVGPCDREFGPLENGCIKDAEDVTCEPNADDTGGGDDDDDGRGADVAADGTTTGERFFDCNVRSTYSVGYTPRAEVIGLVINEIVATQTDLLTDFSEPPCNIPDVGSCEVADLSRCCERKENPDCCRRDEDFMELYNVTDEDIDASGLHLSDGPFDPTRWTFPPGSIIPANTRVIVWLDRDGSQCPNNAEPNKPCYWECPDPNALSMQQDPPEFHTNFGIDADGDQIYLFDTEENGFGLIHGLDFGDPSSICGFTESFGMDGQPRNDILPNQSISCVPDGDRNGTFVITESATPGEENANDVSCGIEFKRGDAAGDGALDLSDGVRILNFLFTGGPAPACRDAADTDDTGLVDIGDAISIFNFLFLGGGPPAPPGPNTCGLDVNEDDLPECVYPHCAS